MKILAIVSCCYKELIIKKHGFLTSEALVKATRVYPRVKSSFRAASTLQNGFIVSIFDISFFLISRAYLCW